MDGGLIAWVLLFLAYFLGIDLASFLEYAHGILGG